MTDRELLERAAKAAGIELRWLDEVKPGYFDADASLWRDWNPLTDDGDALRLGAAVVMSLTYRKVVGSKQGEVAVTAHGHHAVEGYSDDYMAATRRAIVRAAASMADKSVQLGKGGRE